MKLYMRIMLMFLIIFLTGLVFNQFFINRQAAVRYDTFRIDMDKNRAGMIAETLMAEWDSVNWNEFSLFLPGMMRMPREMHDRNKMNMGPLNARTVITDEHGHVLIDTARIVRNGKKLRKSEHEGIPVIIKGNIKAYVYTNSLLDAPLNSGEMMFLNKLRSSVFYSSSLIFALTVMLSGLFLYSMMKPLKGLTSAAAGIASGEYSSRAAESDSGSEIGRLVRQFNDMAVNIESGIEWKKRLISDSAHELRTPLSAMRMRLEMMEEGIYQPDSEQMKILMGEIAHMQSLVESMAYLSELESGQLTLQYSVFSMKDLFGEVVKGCEPKAKKLEVTMTSDCPESLRIRADYRQIKQVLLNLVGNSFKYISPVSGKINLTAGNRNDTVVICVIDNGPGIPVQERVKVFERFYRTDDSRSRQSGGSGLGLSISREIITNHGGRISAEESDGGGLLINIVLPQP